MWFKSLHQANISKQLFIVVLFWLITNLIILGLSSIIFKIFPDFATQYNVYMEEINRLILTLNHEKDIPEQLIVMGKEIKQNLNNSFFYSIILFQSLYNVLNYGVLAIILRKLLFQKTVLPYRKLKLPIIIITLLLFFAAMPILNESIKLNDYLGLDKLDLQAEESSYNVLLTTYSLVVDSNINHQIIIILCMALIPAMGEELFFRGVLQKILSEKIDFHVAILVASLLFSLFHFELVAFFYRFLFGVILGYLYYYTKNIFPSILLHFINNFTSIIALNYAPNLSEINNSDSFPTSVLIFSCFSLAFIFYTLHLYHQQAKE
jgi:membrane protease YdiL (CAAX protease family)